MNQRLKDGHRFHNGAHVVPVGSRDGFGDKYLEVVAKSGLPTIVYCVWEYGPEKASANDWRGYDPLTEAKEIYGQHSPLGSDGVLTIGRTSKLWQEGMEPKEKRDLEAWEPQHYESAIAAANEYWDIVWPIIQQNPQVDVWGAFNEFSEHWKFQNDFYVRLMQHANAKGVTLALGNLSTGNPPGVTEGDFSTFDKWLYWLEYAGEYGHIFCTHEYNEFGTFHVGRFMSMYERMESEFSEGATLPALVVGEMGWVTFPGNERFMESMAVNDELYRLFQYVLGGCCFTYGKWVDANMDTASEPYGQYLASREPWPEQPDAPPDEPDDPPIVDRGKPRFDYKRIVNVVPPDDPLLNAWSWYTYRLTGNENRAVSIFLGGWRRGRETTGGSYDDAFVADLTHRLGRLFDIDSSKEQKFVTFRDDWYPGGVIDFRESVDLSESDEPEPPPESDTLELIWPVAGKRIITSPFGQRELGGFHYGVDMRANEETRVYVAADGIMEFAGYDTSRPDGGFGFYIRIGHDRGKDVYHTYYAHLEDGPDNRGLLWPVGEKLEQGLHTAYANNTGHSFGSHLHFGLKKNGVWVDPILYMRADQKPESPEPPPMPTKWQGIRSVGWRADGGAYREVDDEAFRRMKIDGVKLQTSDDQWTANILVKDAKVDPEKFLVRFFVPPAKWGEAGYTPERFIEEARLPINESWPWGIRWFELFNEPNLTSEYPPGDAEKFTRFAISAALLLKEEWPEIKLVSPALSPQLTTEGWWEMFSNLGLFGLCDGLGAHHYGADANDLLHGNRSYLGLEKYLRGNQQIHLTEFSINRASETDATKGRAYAEFWDSLEPIVARADIFVLSAAKHGENLFEKHRETLVRQTEEISQIVMAIGAR